jgi:hypothetical protein
MKYILLSSIVSLFATLNAPTANAHEGHDKTPGSAAAPHGGIIKGSEHLYLELVTDQGGVKLYPLDHDMKAVAIKDVKIDAKMSIPRTKKTEPVKLVIEGDHYDARIPAKGLNRYDLDLSVTHAAKTEKIKFSVEPL